MDARVLSGVAPARAGLPRSRHAVPTAQGRRSGVPAGGRGEVRLCGDERSSAPLCALSAGQGRGGHVGSPAARGGEQFSRATFPPSHLPTLPPPLHSSRAPQSFGELSLLGLGVRTTTAAATVPTELLVIPASAYESTIVAAHPGMTLLDVEAKFRALQRVPLFREWELFSLYHFAFVLLQRSFTKVRAPHAHTHIYTHARTFTPCSPLGPSHPARRAIVPCLLRNRVRRSAASEGGRHAKHGESLLRSALPPATRPHLRPRTRGGETPRAGGRIASANGPAR